MPTFSPPVSNQWAFSEGPDLDPSERRFWSHFGSQPRGQTVIKTAGTYRTVPHPTMPQIDAADTITSPTGERVKAVFLGGHIYPVTDVVRDELVAAGYEVTP